MQFLKKDRSKRKGDFRIVKEKNIKKAFNEL